MLGNNTPIKDQQYIFSLSFLSIELCVFYIKVWDFVKTTEVTNHQLISISLKGPVSRD